MEQRRIHECVIVDEEALKDKEWSLFIGRYQPLHEGHIKLMRVALDRGDNICIGLRASDKTDSNPYGFAERIEMVEKAFEKEIKENRVKVAILPNVLKVVHGRKVGWSVEEIKLDSETESISATKIREAQSDRNESEKLGQES